MIGVSVELIIVIAILGVLASIAVPRLSGFSEKSRIKADEVSLDLLNKMTDLYAITNNINEGDVFAVLEPKPDTDKARINILVKEGFLDKFIKPQQKDASFKWKKDGEKDYAWKLTDSDGNVESGGGEKTEEEIAAEKAAEEEAKEAAAKAAEEKAAKEKADAIDKAKKDGFTFDEKNEPYTITGYTGSETSLTIPSEIAGVAVTSIAANAFEWKDSKKKLESVTIPDSIISIGKYAFKGNNISTVTLPKRLTEIEEGIFSRNKLSSLTIPDSVTSIGAYAFDLNNLTSVTIPDSVTEVGKHSFYGNKLAKVTIESPNINIGESAFSSNNVIIDLYNIPSGNSKGTWVLEYRFPVIKWWKQ